MKFRVTMKDPDGVYESIHDAAEEAVKSIEDIDDDEREQLTDSRHNKLSEFAGEWIEYGEYAEIEFDTEAKTAVLVKRK